MKDREIEIEARLERSLRSQVKAPRLDGRFDAAVWSRIAAAEQKAYPPLVVRARTPRWLVACNAIGVAVTVALVGWYLARSMSGVDLGIELPVSLPSFSVEQQALVIRKLGAVLSIVAVLFGLMFTRYGRRLVSALR